MLCLLIVTLPLLCIEGAMYRKGLAGEILRYSSSRKWTKEEGMHTFTADDLGLGGGIVMEISCHIIGICVPAMSSSLFSVISSWFFQISTVNVCC